MELHVWKVKLVILWLFQIVSYLAYMFIAFVETGIVGTIEAGSGDGTTIAIFIVVMCLLAWQSYVLRPKVSRWPNIVFASLLFALKALAITGVVSELSIGVFIIELLGAISAALVIWYAWKIPSQVNSERNA